MSSKAKHAESLYHVELSIQTFQHQVMTIKQIIVHKLDLAHGSEQLQAIPASQSLVSSPSLELVLDDLLQTYNKKPDKCYGQFSDLAEDSFPECLKQYMDQSSDEQASGFTQFTTETLTCLGKNLSEAGAINGGYVMFADYQQGLTRYLLLCMLSSQHSVTITDELTIQDTSYLDTARMSLACRINITDWQKNPEAGRYLSFLRPKGGKRLSTVFQEVIGCSETSSSKKEADTLLKAVEAYCQEEPVEENRTIVKRQVYDYCQNRLDEGESLSMQELTGHLSEAGPDDFARFVNTRDYDMSTPMSPERRKLTQLVRYTGRSKGLSLSFDAELLGGQIRYDESNDQLIITGVPDQLKAQLKQK
ncbi:nucleoid-associated protein [Endozoicomonas sp. YOMI1]|uniref:nucleoid-associated protein n=1 Tax=Endozoicomonas sp. YOMI1 TaxID=2828739 RepID=UPI0021485B08|nr:nucleoid-associated protein [Endozoicomonas sp. YOMI1]